MNTMIKAANKRKYLIGGLSYSFRGHHGRECSDRQTGRHGLGEVANSLHPDPQPAGRENKIGPDKGF